MKTTRKKIEPAKMTGQSIGRINPAQVDATTETQISSHMKQDEALAMQDAATVRLKTADLPDFDMAEYLQTNEDVANYLTLVLAENDPAELIHALSTIARARGMAEVARASGLTREALYKALRPTSNPRFDTIARVCKALGVRLVVQPMQA
jgi:probable addiction module antidote protein